MTSKANPDPLRSHGKPPSAQPSPLGESRRRRPTPPPPPPLLNGGDDDDDDDDDRNDTYYSKKKDSGGWERLWNAATATTTTTSAAALPSLGHCLKATLGVTVALYILNQNHLLPRPLSAAVSKALFWPTLPITVARRWGQWESVIDGTVVMGGAPFGFARLPQKLYQQYGVRTCKCTILYST
jgi:hypothetical protein